MAYALGLPDALRHRGLTVEVVPGWETRSAGSFNPKGAVAHWTAGPRGSVTRPSLAVVVNGRPGLDGPLCNVYGARDGVAVVVAAGRANHAGEGSWRGLVGNSAVFGTEMEGADATDFTEAQRWAYPRIHAAYCDLGDFGPEMNCGHSEWAGPRKIDINGYTPDDLRSGIAAVLAGEDDDMFTEVDRNALYRVHDAIHGGKNILLPNVLDGLKTAVAALPGAVVTGALIDDPDADARTGKTGNKASLGVFAREGARAALRAEQIARVQQGAIDALTGLVAEQNGLTLDDVKRVVDEGVAAALAAGINVDVTVGSRDS